jgi:2'-5' RNA ligase
MPDAPETWRLFIAIDLGLAAREALRAAQDECRRLDLPVRWVEPAGAHLTLKFLGDTDRALVAPLGEALRAVAADHRPFALRTAAPGVFPTLRRPRVLWLGLDGDRDRLDRLHRALDAALVPLGFAPETRPFSPHLTLGRVRDDRAREMAAAAPRLDAAFARLAARPGAPLPVEAIHLIRSELRPGGARYTTLVSAPLGTADV